MKEVVVLVQEVLKV